MSAIWQGFVLFYCSSSRLRKHHTLGTHFWSTDLEPQEDHIFMNSHQVLGAGAIALTEHLWIESKRTLQMHLSLISWPKTLPVCLKGFITHTNVAKEKLNSPSHSLWCFCNLGLGCTCLKKKWGKWWVPSHFKATVKQRRSSCFTRNNLCICWRKNTYTQGGIAPGWSKNWLGKAEGQGLLKLNKSKFILLTDVAYIKAIRNSSDSQFLKNN